MQNKHKDDIIIKSMNESLVQNQPEQDEKDGRIIQHVIGSMAVVGRLPDQIIDETLTRSREAPVRNLPGNAVAFR